MEGSHHCFFVKYKQFESLQQIYMPKATTLWDRKEEQRDNGADPPLAEDVDLFLPSYLGGVDGDRWCGRDLMNMEERIRDAQCCQSLISLRWKLHAKAHLIHFRNIHVTGQRDSTKSRGEIDKVGVKISLQVAKYRQARIALLALRGGANCAHYPELLDSDVMLHEESVEDGQTLVCLGRLGSERSRAHAAVSRERKKRLSWIWTSLGGPDADKERVIHDGRSFLLVHFLLRLNSCACGMV